MGWRVAHAGTDLGGWLIQQGVESGEWSCGQGPWKCGDGFNDERIASFWWVGARGAGRHASCGWWRHATPPHAQMTRRRLFSAAHPRHEMLLGQHLRV